MTITLQRPEAPETGAADFHRYAALRLVRGESASEDRRPISPPIRRRMTPRSAGELPPGVRLVRRRTEPAPSLTLGRKLAMLAPAALLAGVSAGAVTLPPHLHDLVDSVRDHFADPGVAAAPHSQAASPHSGPKHRGRPAPTPQATQSPDRPKHRAATSAQTSSRQAPVPPTTANTPAKTAAGKHRAASSDEASGPTTVPPKPESKPVSEPVSETPNPGSSDPTPDALSQTLRTVDGAVDELASVLGLGD